MWLRFVGAFACLSLIIACSDDDDDDRDGGPYSGVVEWKCFEGSDCWCVGLGPGDEADSSDPEVNACSFTTCYVYHPFEDDEDSWHCSCGPEDYEPASFWVGVETVPACPPE